MISKIILFKREASSNTVCIKPPKFQIPTNGLCVLNTCHTSRIPHQYDLIYYPSVSLATYWSNEKLPSGVILSKELYQVYIATNTPTHTFTYIYTHTHTNILPWHRYFLVLWARIPCICQLKIKKLNLHQ